MSKVFIQSCHASLEYDQALMFLGMGEEWRVAGNFDTGSKQRPKVPGITDVSYDVRDALRGEADFIVLHQVEDYSNVFLKYCQATKAPVILNYFGQGCEEQHRHVVRILMGMRNSYVVCYSRKEERMLSEFGAPKEKLRMIRFGKIMEEFGPWNGKLPVAYMTCNSIKRRGAGCQWSVMESLMQSSLPILLSGQETEQLPNGIGELSYDLMRKMYCNARCFVSLGTMPAPMVLTQIEAACSGCPVIVLDNGCGVAEEGLPFMVVKLEIELWDLINQVTTIPKAIVSAMSQGVLEAAKKEFDMVTIAAQWKSFMEEMKHENPM